MNETNFNSITKETYAAKAKSLNDIERLILNTKDLPAVKFDWEKQVQGEAEALIESGKSRGTVCIALIKTIHQAGYLNHVISVKLSELSKLIIFSMNTDNFVGLGVGSRSLFEHAASVAYLFHESKKLEEALGRQHEEQKVMALLNSFTTKLEKLYYGTGYFGDESKRAKPIHINELIKSLGKDVQDVRNKYAYLCDFVHPNLGVNLLFSDGGLGQGIVDPEPNVIERLVGGIIELNGDMARYVLDTQISITAILVIKLQRMCDDLISSEATLNAILSGTAKNYYRGSGRSADDPIEFVGVNSHSQYFGALERFLFEESIGIETRRTSYGKDKVGQTFDIFSKNGEEVWVLVNYSQA